MPMIGVAALTVAGFVCIILLSQAIYNLGHFLWVSWLIQKDERSHRPQEDDDGRCEDDDYLFRCGIEIHDSEGEK